MIYGNVTFSFYPEPIVQHYISSSLSARPRSTKAVSLFGLINPPSGFLALSVSVLALVSDASYVGRLTSRGVIPPPSHPLEAILYEGTLEIGSASSSSASSSPVLWSVVGPIRTWFPLPILEPDAVRAISSCGEKWDPVLRIGL